MRVDKAVDKIKATVLKQIAAKTDTTTVTGFIDDAVLEIYKRYNLWEDEAVITVADSTLLYKLDGSDTNVDIDLSDHRLLMITSVCDEDDEEFVINDKNDATSIFIPKYHQIRIPAAVASDIMTVTYRAAPLAISSGNQEIDIPPQFLDVMYNYVGYKGHSTIKVGKESTSASYFGMFIRSLAVIDAEGLFSQDDMNSTKFTDRGYV